MEGTLFAFSSFSKPLSTTSSDYYNYLNTTFSSNLVSTISAAYPISMYSSTVAPAIYAIAAVITDAQYACPTRRALTTSLKTQLGTYTYLWNHVPSCRWTPTVSSSSISYLGATHTSELAFVFGETSNLPQPDGTCQLSTNEQMMSTQIITAWQSMAQNGYPTFTNGSKWLDWSQGGQGVLFDNSLTFSTINRTQCDFWDEIQMMNGSINTINGNTGTIVSYDSTAISFVLVTVFIFLCI